MKAFWMFLVFLDVARNVYGDPVFLGVARNVYGDGECDKPTGKENMVLFTKVEFPVPEGTSVRFRCRVDAETQGSGTVTCNNGQWSDLKLKCKMQSCGSAGEVKNGRVVYSPASVEFVTLAHVECNKGYYLVGKELFKYCGLSGWWEGQFPVCEDGCLTPPFKENMFLSPGVEFPVPEGTSVNFKCQIGFETRGSGIVTCTNRQWSDLQMECEIKTCGSAGEVENGRVVYPEETTFGSEAHVVCNEGYNVVGPNKIYCGFHEWGDRLPVCEAIECKAPEITHGEVVDVRRTYKYLDEVTLECSEGHTLTGDSVLTCGENSQWSGTKPQCTMFRSSSERTSEVKLLSVIGLLGLRTFL